MISRVFRVKVLCIRALTDLNKSTVIIWNVLSLVLIKNFHSEENTKASVRKTDAVFPFLKCEFPIAAF